MSIDGSKASKAFVKSSHRDDLYLISQEIITYTLNMDTINTPLTCMCCEAQDYSISGRENYHTAANQVFNEANILMTKKLFGSLF